MQDIKVFDHNGVLVTDSRDVAVMVEKTHNELLKDIRRYCGHLNAGDFPHVDFFIPSTYQDSKGETRPCYLITRKGCEMIANKMTGAKGVLFTAAYINRFHAMEDYIKSQRRLPPTVNVSISGLASLINTLTRTMREKGNTIMEIAIMQNVLCNSCGVFLPDCFTTPPQWEQTTIAGYLKEGGQRQC